MHSPIVQDREAAARDLVATLQLHGKRVGALLAEIFEPLLEDGEELPDYVLLQRLMARSVRASLADLLAADEAHLAVLGQIEEESGPDGPEDRQTGPFLRARLDKTEAERQAAIEEFDDTYGSFGKVLEALYVLAGEEEVAERLRPRALASDLPLPEPALEEAEIPEPLEDGDEEDQVQRRIFSRRLRRPGLSRWMGIRIFRRRRFHRR